MKILYIGEPETANLVHAGIAPAHWLYGAMEMEKSGEVVVWEKERHALLNDLKLLMKHRPDKIFIPNLNIGNHQLLLALKAVGIVRTPVDAFLHHGRLERGIRGLVIRLLLSGVDKLSFLSQKSMQETVDAGNVKSTKCDTPGWWPDAEYYSKIKTSDNGRFVSTGKENRDFDTLIEAFCITGAPLTIMTAHKHGSESYDNLYDKCRDVPNIKVVITENTGAVYPQMVKEMAAARALVCPLLQNRMSYCVGLSTIADAVGLGKPLIITRNPYHDDCYIGEHTYRVATVEDWVAAIRALLK
jgi:glycosyltransferase involved in cell wall biosynthesis